MSGELGSLSGNARLSPISQPVNIAKFSAMRDELDIKLKKSNAEFATMDRDKDGRLSRDEAAGIKDFGTLDRNSDGFLDSEEFSLKTDPIPKPTVASSASNKAAEMRAWYAAKMRKDDKDGNGFLAVDEVSDPSVFAKADTNQDGKISLDEYIGMRSR